MSSFGEKLETPLSVGKLLFRLVLSFCELVLSLWRGLNFPENQVHASLFDPTVLIPKCLLQLLVFHLLFISQLLDRVLFQFLLQSPIIPIQLFKGLHHQADGFLQPLDSLKRGGTLLVNMDVSGLVVPLRVSFTVPFDLFESAIEELLVVFASPDLLDLLLEHLAEVGPLSLSSLLFLENKAEGINQLEGQEGIHAHVLLDVEDLLKNLLAGEYFDKLPEHQVAHVPENFYLLVLVLRDEMVLLHEV